MVAETASHHEVRQRRGRERIADGDEIADAGDEVELVARRETAAARSQRRERPSRQHRDRRLADVRRAFIGI